jgi:hypothetical protein
VHTVIVADRDDVAAMSFAQIVNAPDQFHAVLRDQAWGGIGPTERTRRWPTRMPSR